MINTIIQKEKLDIRDLIDQVDTVKIFLEINKIDEGNASLFNDPIVKLINFMESEKYIELNVGINNENWKNDFLIKKLKLIRVALTQKKIDKVEEYKKELVNESFSIILDEILKELLKLKKNPYEVWLRENKNLINKLNLELDASNYEYRTIKDFVLQFKEFVGKKIYVKLLKNHIHQFDMTPVMFVDGQFIELKHPITKERWIILGSVTKYKESLNKLKLGSILKVNFGVVPKNSMQYKAFITINYDGYEILEEDIDSLIKSHFNDLEMEAVYQSMQVKGDSKLLLNRLAKLMIPDNETFKKEIDKAIEGNTMLEEDLNNLNEKRQAYLKKIHELDTEFSVEQKKWSEILARIEYFVDYEEEISETLSYNSQTFINDLQSRIYYGESNNLIYDSSILEIFLAAVRSNILTILTGPSGTGKSSLVEALGNAIKNVKVTMISVQSSWTDAQDLLGYFHPNEKIFVATPFMEALAAARIAEKSNKEELHIICLDEMNLAHIEYYFAQFLSIREQKNPSIQLYPKRYEQWAFGVDTGEIEVDSFAKQNAIELIEKYPATFNIPSNVRFVGTLNMDHTVKSLSPKVIDRSLIIELVKLSLEDEVNIIKQIKKNGNDKKIEIHWNEFIDTTYSVDENIVKDILDISNIFTDFRDIPLNGRGLKHLHVILSYWSDQSEEGLVKLKDLLIKGKVLPRIEVKKTAIENIDILGELNGYKLSKGKMATMLNTNHTVSFW